jgi:hypothetical protein
VVWVITEGAHLKPDRTFKGLFVYLFGLLDMRFNMVRAWTPVSTDKDSNQTLPLSCYVTKASLLLPKEGWQRLINPS